MPRSVIDKIDGNRCQRRLDQSGQTIRYRKQLEVIFETIDLHEGRWLFRMCAIKALIYEEGDYSELPFIFLKRKLTKILTLPSEDFWPASTGLLWYYSIFSGLLATFDNVEDSSAHWSSKYHHKLIIFFSFLWVIRNYIKKPVTWTTLFWSSFSF